MISFPCPKCGRTAKVKDYLAGTRVKCRQCGQTNRVPDRKSGQAAPAPTPAQAHGRTAPSRPASARAADGAGRNIRAKIPAPAGSPEEVTIPPKGPGPATQPTLAATSAAADTGTGREPGASDNGQTLAPAREAGSESYEFLAPPEGPDELGRLGGYRVLKVLGAGGMGVVFQAEDPQLGRPVALKAMLPDLVATPGARARFLREARAAAAVKHDHVVTVYQVGEDRFVPFLAMEFLQGESLQERLGRPQALPTAEVVRIGREVAEGLAAAHAKGLIHRDIKPANVWLEGEPGAGAPGGRVKVLDFGLARTGAEDSRLTQAGIVVGTPAYMSPEQANALPVDHRSDLFSLGCVLYHMATGRQPFQGADAISTMVAVATAQPPAPHEVNPALPPALSDLIVRLLEKDPARRPQTAAEVVEALARLRGANDGPTGTATWSLPPAVAAPGPGPGGGAAEWADIGETAGEPGQAEAPTRRRRRPLLLVGALTVLLLLAGAVVTGTLLYWVSTNRGELRLQSEDPQAEVVVTQDGKPVLVLDAAARPRADLRPGQYGLVLSGDARDFRLSTNTLVLAKGEQKVVSVRRLPAPVAEAPRQPAPAAEVRPQPVPTAAPQEPTGTMRPARPGFPSPTSAPLPTLPEVRIVLAPGMSRTIDVRVDRREVGGPVELRAEDLPPGIVVPPLTIPADEGRGRLTVAAEAGAGEQGARSGRLVIAAGGKHREQPLAVVLTPPLALTGHTVPVRTVIFSPDGSRLASAGTDGNGRASTRGEVKVWDATTGNLVCSLDTRGESAVSNLTFSPDGAHFATFSGGGAVGIWATATGSEVHALGKPLKARVSSLQYSPDGALLAASGYGPQVVLWDARTGKEVRRLTGTLPAPAAPGPVLVRPGMRGVPAAAPRPVRAVVQLAFRQDGRYLAGACGDSGVAVVWDVLTGREGLPLTGHAGRVDSVAFSPDGTRLATAGGAWSVEHQRAVAPEVKVWDAQNGAQLLSVQPRRVDEAPDNFPHVSFSPGNKYVANVMTGRGERPAALDVWDVLTGRKVLAADGVGAISFFPDGARLAGAGTNGTVRVWSLPDGDEVVALAGSGAAVRGVAVSPEGARLATADADDSARVWAVPRARAVVTIQADAQASWSGQPFAGR